MQSSKLREYDTDSDFARNSVYLEHSVGEADNGSAET